MSSSETLSSRAADSLPSSTAVGLLSPRSILLIIARETPDAPASRSMDQPRPCRSPREPLPERIPLIYYSRHDSTHIRFDRPSVDDAEAICAIRNDVIEHSTAMWTTRLLTAEDGKAWLEENLARRSAYVAEAAGDVIGFANWAPWRPKDGYRHTVEDSVYLVAGHQGRGIGAELLRTLIAGASESGAHVMMACIEATNARVGRAARAGRVSRWSAPPGRSGINSAAGST